MNLEKKTMNLGDGFKILSPIMSSHLVALKPWEMVMLPQGPPDTAEQAKVLIK